MRHKLPWCGICVCCITMLNGCLELEEYIFGNPILREPIIEGVFRYRLVIATDETLSPPVDVFYAVIEEGPEIPEYMRHPESNSPHLTYPFGALLAYEKGKGVEASGPLDDDVIVAEAAVFRGFLSLSDGRQIDLGHRGVVEIEGVPFWRGLYLFQKQK